MEQSSQPKRAFVTAIGKFKMMPFGLAGAPSVFQHYWLADVPDYTTAYLDDIAVFSNSWTDHLEHLKTVLTKIKESGLILKMAKCK